MPQIVITDLGATGLPWARFQRGSQDVIAVDRALPVTKRLALLASLGVRPELAHAVA